MSTFQGSASTSLIMPRLRLISRVALSHAQLDRIMAGVEREVKAIVDEDGMEHQASVNRRFRDLREVSGMFMRLCSAHTASQGNPANEKQR